MASCFKCARVDCNDLGYCPVAEEEDMAQDLMTLLCERTNSCDGE